MGAFGGMIVSTRPHDVLVFGATGFTGRQAAQYLDRHAPAGLKLALAGRNRAKLAEVAGSLTRSDVAIVIADASQPETVHAMCASTRVVATTAGPFSLYGTPVIEGCIQHKTHYCDITGETPWVRDMIDRFDAQARADGTRLVPFSGYDSCPSDLGAFLIAKELRARGEDTVRVDGFHTGKGGVNGGTLATMLTLAAQGRMGDAAQPFLLNPGGAPSAQVALASQNPTRVMFHARARRYTAPFFMGEINTRVVRRSAGLLAEKGAGYGPDFVYQEYFDTKNWLVAHLIAGALALATRAAQQAAMRSIMARLGPQPGAGPSEHTMDNGFARSRFYGTGSAGTLVDAEVSGPGDPGNRITIQFLCESALALALDEARLPKGGGFLTPATAFGDVLIDRARARGLRLDITTG